ncbi:MAG: L,D-transpeptidase family protein, partial [Candidatus Omnitrophica bacterium]|nr:L,D-transpeptidase family protein [Candidatus Omnitrophota bacterium]
FLIIIFAAFVFLIALIIINIKKGGPSLNTGIDNGPTLSGLISQAKELEAQNNLLQAKNIYQKLIGEFPNSDEIMHWQKKLEEINLKLLFSPAIIPQSTSYEIKQGDSLSKIAAKFNTTVELIKKSNNIKDDIIMPGKKIKVSTATFNLIIDKSQNTLMLKTGEEIIKTYIVSTGKDNSTPTGTFIIINKLLNPTWFKSGAVIASGSPDNILGTRWMGFDLAGYGIHGTTEPEKLGQQVTAGCVRMSNSEVEELYSILPKGTEVLVVD